jgi:2,4-dienoyl-CoA reductase-like NADH-dependent reductase (Old Yellow Enzyme family)
MSGQSSDPLFTPLKVGKVQLKHRIVMAPLTRNRATVPTFAPNDLIAEYYEQRASDGGLLITEVSFGQPPRSSLASLAAYGAYSGTALTRRRRIPPPNLEDTPTPRDCTPTSTCGNGRG